MRSAYRQRLVRFTDRESDIDADLAERARREGVSANELMKRYLRRGLDNDDARDRRNRRR